MTLFGAARGDEGFMDFTESCEGDNTCIARLKFEQDYNRNNANEQKINVEYIYRTPRKSLMTSEGESIKDEIADNVNTFKESEYQRLDLVKEIQGLEYQTSVYDEESEIPEESIIHWYKYHLYEGISDALAGAFWEEILEDDGSPYNHLSLNISPEHGVDFERYKVIVESPYRDYIYTLKYPYDEHLELVFFPLNFFINIFIVIRNHIFYVFHIPMAISSFSMPSTMCTLRT